MFKHRGGKNLGVISTDDMLRRIEDVNLRIMMSRRAAAEGDGRGNDGMGHGVDDRPLTIVGSDVEALFPSLEKGESAKICKEMVTNSTLEFRNIDVQEMLLYIRLNMEHATDLGVVRSFLPQRAKKFGKDPGMTSPLVRSAKKLEDTKGKDDQQWVPGLTPTSPKIIRQIVGLVVEIGVKTIFSNFCYTFGGKIFLQLQGPHWRQSDYGSGTVSD